MVSVKWSEDSLRDLEDVDAIIAQRIVGKVTWLRENFPNIVPEKLHHDLKNLYKLRIGDWRVMYSVSGNLIIIESVGHRKDVYDR